MSTLTNTDYTRIATEGGESFVEAYYGALNSARSSIKTYYVATTGANTERGLPFISFNGEVIQDADELQQEFELSGYTFFEPQSVDVHVLNPTMGVVTDSNKTREAEKSLSMVVQVSGSVRIDERQTGPLKGFSDSFVLVPNPQATGRGRQSDGKKWLIQSQQFRFVVDNDEDE